MIDNERINLKASFSRMVGVYQFPCPRLVHLEIPIIADFDSFVGTVFPPKSLRCYARQADEAEYVRSDERLLSINCSGEFGSTNEGHTGRMKRDCSSKPCHQR